VDGAVNIWVKKVRSKSGVCVFTMRANPDARDASFQEKSLSVSLISTKSRREK
jgi:hypothetical protein